MEELVKNAFFQFAGWIFTVVGGVIAIFQVIANKRLKKKIVEKDAIISNLQIQINNQSISTRSRNVAQGEKSQYIETSNAPINIDIG